MLRAKPAQTPLSSFIQFKFCRGIWRYIFLANVFRDRACSALSGSQESERFTIEVIRGHSWCPVFSETFACTRIRGACLGSVTIRKWTFARKLQDELNYFDQVWKHVRWEYC